MKRHKLIELLEQVAEFSNEEKKLIFDVLNIKDANKGDFLLEFNEVCKSINFILSGVVRFFIHNDDGDELTTAFLSEDEFAMRIESFLRQTPSNGYLQCETFCEFISISRSDWDLLCKKTKNFGYAMGQIGSITVAKKMELQRRLLSQEAKESYLDFLKYNSTIAERVPLKHISSYLGITPSSLSRIKKEITES